MKIIHQNTVKTFGDLEVGDVFMVEKDDDTHIKISVNNDGDNTLYSESGHCWLKCNYKSDQKVTLFPNAVLCLNGAGDA